MKILIVKNNYCFLDQLKMNYEQIYFAPKVYSKNQLKFQRDRYNYYKGQITNIKWGMPEQIITGDKIDYLAWDAFDERKESNNKILPLQNRLFDGLDFEILDGFTSFRKKAEEILPEKFKATIGPIDKDVMGRLNYYFNESKQASHYFETRNGVVGNNYSTQLSSFLSCGSLDVRYLYNYIKNYENEFGANKSTYWLIFELLWREFFYWHYQKHGSLYFSENGLHLPKEFSPPKVFNSQELFLLDSPKLFKAALNELISTGHLSNRIRQLFASIWINDLKLPWRSGALFFEHHMIDYDVYSNYGNWMYLAGVGVDPRGKRYFNIDKQLATYDPEGNYLLKWS